VQRIAQPGGLVKQALAFACLAGEIPPKVLSLGGYVINLFQGIFYSIFTHGEYRYLINEAQGKM